MLKFGRGVVKHRVLVLILAVLLMAPAALGMANTRINCDMPDYLPEDMDTVIGQNILLEDFGKGAQKMLKEIENLDGVEYALGLDSLLGGRLPEEVLPESLVGVLKSDWYQLMLVNSSCRESTDDCNRQIDEINAVIKKHDEGAMLIGEAPCTKDLISVTDHDFEVVNWISIGK